MPNFKDLAGSRFGRLVALSPIRINGLIKWNCICDCGVQKVIDPANFRNGSTNSCGCMRNTQGGLTRKHPMWRRWSNMLARCNDPKNKDYNRYGGRGIKVCERWLKFENFLEDMESSYFTGGTLERCNNDGDYDPANVIWATREAQNKNRRKTFQRAI